LVLIVLPIDSALTGAPVTKLIGNAAEIFEVSPAPPVPSSGALMPGRFSNVMTVPSGCRSLIVKSPTDVCVSWRLVTETLVIRPGSGTETVFEAIDPSVPL
jgi:hypothetical protein